MDSDSPHRWHVLQVFAGSEDKVLEMFLTSMTNLGMEESCSDTFIPRESIVSVRRGKKISVKRKLFPGYIFMKIDALESTLDLIKGVPKVIGFLGDSGIPKVIPDEEVESIKERLESGISLVSSKTSAYEVGEEVKITDGPFQSFVGSVDSVNENRDTLKVVISIFGKMTKIELEMNQVEKV